MRASLMTALALSVSWVLGAQDTVRVRVDTPPRWGAAPRLVEMLRIGQPDGPPEYAFGNLLHVAVAPDGSFFTYDQDDRQIRAYDAAGRFVALVGRSGKGSGEYEHVAAMAVNRESLLVVHDPNSARITYFDRAGKLRRSHPIDANAFYGHGVLLDAADRI